MISVIIPVYNVENYLDKCLSSVLTNTYRDLEVICVNDGSTDGSAELLRKWQAADPRIVVVSHENRGLPEARNSGLAHASGEYTAFIDADDWVHPQFFESLLDCMEETGADMVICGVRELAVGEEYEAAPVSELRYRKLTAKEFYKNCYARRMIWGRLLRRRDTESLRFPPEVDAHQDTLYNMRLIAGLEQPKVFMIDTPMYFYLQRPDSLYKSRSYEEMIGIADWYAENERDPLHRKSGEWGGLLLLHVVSTVLSCRYQARLCGNRELAEHTNDLLRVMMADLARDRTLSPMDKTSRTAMILFPFLYRWFRELNRTAIKVK